MLDKVRTILLAVSAITDQVSTRIYYGSPVKGATMPFIVLDADPGTPNETKSGVSELDQIPMEITVSAEVYHTESGITGAYEIAELVESALDFYSGMSGTNLFIKKSIPINIIPLSIPDHERYDASITFEVYKS